jgi:hypothetical protein
MPIQASNPVSLPARTLNLWWLSQILLIVNPDTGAIRIQYAAARGDEDGFMSNPANQIARQVILDVAAAFANDPTSLQNLATASAAIEALVAQDMTNKGII